MLCHIVPDPAVNHHAQVRDDLNQACRIEMLNGVAVGLCGARLQEESVCRHENMHQDTTYLVLLVWHWLGQTEGLYWILGPVEVRMSPAPDCYADALGPALSPACGSSRIVQVYAYQYGK